MGIKISELPPNNLPYSGSEEIPIVQNLITKAATLSSFVNYLSGDFAFVNRTNNFTQSQAIAGNLTVTGDISATTFNAVSANFSIIDIKQYELSGFDVTGNVSIAGNLSATGNVNITGSLSTVGVANFANNLTAQGNLAVSGIGAIDTTSSSPALRVAQRGTGLALHVSNGSNNALAVTSDGSVGVGTQTPNEKLTVSGNISSTGTITSSLGVVNASSTLPAFRVTQVGSGPALLVEDSPSTDSTPFIITSGGDVGIGTSTPNEKLTVVGDISATQIVFADELDFGSPERPSFTGIKQALNSFLYVSPDLSYMKVNGGLSVILEVGQALVAPAITWTSNKVEAPAISGYRLALPNGSVQAGSLTYTFSSYNDPNTYDIDTLPGTNTQATSSWTVTVTDWNNVSNTATATAYWRYRVYFGATNQTSPTDTIVRTNADETVLATARTGLGAKTITASNEYLYVAYPQRFGTTSILRVDGFNLTDFTQVDITTFTNAQGGTGSYYVYRSNNLLTGSYRVEII